MAEVVEKMDGMVHEHEIPSNGKVNAALTTGIIGTSLSGLMALGALGIGKGILGIGGNNCGNWNNCVVPTQTAGCPVYNTCGVPSGDLYNERKETQDYIDLTKQYYEGQIETQGKIDKNFFDLYKMNVDTSFGLYKNHIDDSFALYKSQRDTKDELVAKIDKLERQVDVMSAVRPYQDALINAKIDNVALVGDFNLARRTCRMIQGELVLPSTPTVTGYPSYCCCSAQPSAATAGA